MRLVDIDAPEKGQAFGQRSEQFLSDLCFKKPAVVKPKTRDRFGRTVARVECDGADASLEQVTAGVARIFDRYLKDRGLYTVPGEAREAKRGLWAGSAPAPPWEWRKRTTAN